MSETGLSSTIAIRITPALHAELCAVSEREGVSCGRIIRRALRAELDGVEAHRLDPYAGLPPDEIQGYLDDLGAAIGNPARTQDIINTIGDEVVDVMDASAQVLDVLGADVAHQRLERASGYLQQASGHLLRAAYRVKALRFLEGLIADGAERVVALPSAEGSPNHSYANSKGIM